MPQHTFPSEVIGLILGDKTAPPSHQIYRQNLSTVLNCNGVYYPTEGGELFKLHKNRTFVSLIKN